jgi:hypothetical protein
VGRYVCQIGKDTNIGKANKFCLLRRCPELAVKRPIIERGKLKHIIVPVILEDFVDVMGRC